MSTATAAPAAKRGQGASAQAATMRPFRTGSKVIDQPPGYDQSKALTASTQQLPRFELDTDGYTSGLWILSECTGVGNATVTASFTEDGALAAYTFTFYDTNSKPIIGPMSGHDLYECVKLGGYFYEGDIKASHIYSVTSGTGSAQGSWTFALYIPIEIVHRDGLGSLLNKSASAVFKLDISLAPLATIYASAPATSATVRTRITQVGWMDSDTRDIKGNPTSPQPPALNTIQYWDKQSFTLTAGTTNQRLNNFSGGIRNLIFELRDSNGTRSGNPTDFWDPFIFQVDKFIPVNRYRKMWQQFMSNWYDHFGAEVLMGVSGTPATEGDHQDNGIFAEPFTRDFGLQPGAENRFGYLWVTSATALKVVGTLGGSGAHTLNIFVNYVNPAGGDPRALTGGR